MPIVITSNAWEIAVVDKMRFQSLAFRLQRHGGSHLDIRLLKGVAARLLGMSANPDIVHRVTTADGTPLCVVVRGPSTLSSRTDWSRRAGRGDHAMSKELQARTIADFGEQWTSYPDSEGFFGSAELFDDFVKPLVSVAMSPVAVSRRSAQGRAGSSTCSRRPERHTSSPWSLPTAFRVLREKTRRFEDRITYLNATGDQLPATGDLDYVFAIGVLHHIPDPDPVVAAAFRALRRGGQLAVWLYGREGNTLYLLLVRSLWWLTRRLPHRGLEVFVRLLYPLFWCYMTACRLLPLPLAAYMRRVMRPLAPDKRRVVIYDQLNPAYAKYYTRGEAHALLARHEFTDIRLHHRHGISWTVVGTKG